MDHAGLLRQAIARRHGRVLSDGEWQALKPDGGLQDRTAWKELPPNGAYAATRSVAIP
jgi:hypothetical protein